MTEDGRRYRAVLIGNGEFPNDPHGLPSLYGPAADVTLLSQALVASEGALFAEGDVRILVDRRVQKLRESLAEFFASAQPDDVLLLYYSGHGMLDLENRLHLCAKDTRAGSLLWATALRADDVNEMITSCSARSTIVVLDCCHSGAFKGADVLRGMDPLTDPAAGGSTTPHSDGGFRSRLGGFTGWRRGGSRSTSNAGGPGPDPARESPSSRPGFATRTGHRGRYVLASSRSTQLARDTAEPGEPSPFTAALVRGLTRLDPGENVTVPELYRRVHRWVGEQRGPTPQLRFSGEGELMIARHPGVPNGSNQQTDLPRQSHTDSSAVITTSARPPDGPEPAASANEEWRCRRIRDSGIDCLLELRRGTARHVIEYRSTRNQLGMILVDGREIYRGSSLLDCDFTVGRNRVRARLQVTETDIRLDIHGRQVYGLGRAGPGSADQVEERAAAIRASLLARYGAAVKTSEMRLRVTPWLRLSDVNAVRDRTGRSARSSEPTSILAIVTHRHTVDSAERIWFTDRAMHVRGKDRTLVVSYERLAEIPVSDDRAVLKIGKEKIDFSGFDEMLPIRKVIDAVRAAVVYQQTGLGDPPPLHRYSGGSAMDGDVERRKVGPAPGRDVHGMLCGLISGFGTLQVVYAPESVRVDSEFDHLAIGLLVMAIGAPWFFAAHHLSRTRLFRSFGGRLSLAALSSCVFVALLNWLPVVWNAGMRAGGSEEWPFYGWLIRFGDSGGIAIGGVETGALGEWPRVWGTLLLAAVMFAVVTTDLIMLHRERRRVEREQSRSNAV